jgi:hypothetical protein
MVVNMPISVPDTNRLQETALGHSDHVCEQQWVFFVRLELQHLL